MLTMASIQVPERLGLSHAHKGETMAGFTLDLTDDQNQIKDWVHSFSNDVIRPVAHDYDEREETPWEIIQEAANVGLYSWEFLAQAFADETGLTMPIAMEELFWGDAGIGLSIMGTALGVSGILGNGTPEQIGEWIPQCFGTPEKVGLAAFAVSSSVIILSCDIFFWNVSSRPDIAPKLNFRSVSHRINIP